MIFKVWPFRQTNQQLSYDQPIPTFETIEQAVERFGKDCVIVEHPLDVGLWHISKIVDNKMHCWVSAKQVKGFRVKE